jgi:hypothetical protein
MNMVEIEHALRQLRLSGIAETLSTRVMQAQAAQESFLETFAAMLQDELDRRRSRLTERRYKRSGLDENVWLTSTGASTPSCPARPALSCTPLSSSLRDPTRSSSANPAPASLTSPRPLRTKPRWPAHDVRYLEADTEFARYALVSATERIGLIKEWVEPDLLILDDLFLARRISEHAAEVLQAIVHQRYKLRRAIVVTSNRVIQDWGRYLGDATMATTVLDRLMHRCTMLEFEGKSYRLKEAAARIAINPESS